MQHVIFRRTRASGEKIEFETDYYDIHRVPYQLALNNPRIWQANFMGGARLYKLLNRLSLPYTLANFLDEKAAKNGWKIAEGWIESPNALPIRRAKYLKSKVDLSINEARELTDLEVKYNADWITGYPYVETDSFTEDGIGRVDTCNLKYFYRSAKNNKEIFQPPHLLIKESVTGQRIPVVYSDQNLTFKDKVLGIHAPIEDIAELKKLGEYLREKNNVALMWLLSGQVLTSREGVPLKGDILKLPYPEIEIDQIEDILLQDINMHYSGFRKEGEKSTVLDPVTDLELRNFGEVFCRILNTIYQKFRPMEPIIGKEFLVYPFVLGVEPEVQMPATLNTAEEKLRFILNQQVNYNLWVKRILKVYDKNVIFLYKPNQKRYWLRSVAIRDADETFMDLYSQGK